VQHDGKLYANNANIKGHIEATSGSFENIEFKNRIDVSNLPAEIATLSDGELRLSAIDYIYDTWSFLSLNGVNTVVKVKSLCCCMETNRNTC
jgi:hypothetical protein